MRQHTHPHFSPPNMQVRLECIVVREKIGKIRDKFVQTKGPTNAFVRNSPFENNKCYN